MNQTCMLLDKWFNNTYPNKGIMKFVNNDKKSINILDKYFNTIKLVDKILNK